MSVSLGRATYDLCVSITAGVLVALMVATAAVAIERTSEAGCLAADSAPCAPEPVEWCTSLNGQMICLGEPT
jgi:hypothetical protein